MVRLYSYIFLEKELLEKDGAPIIDQWRDMIKWKMKQLGARWNEWEKQVPTATPSATTNPENIANDAKAQTKQELIQVKTKSEVSNLQKDVGMKATESKLLNLDTSLRTMMVNSPKLLWRLELSGLDVLGEIDKLGEVFAWAMERYIWLEKDEARRFSNGIVASLFDSLTTQANKDQATLEKEKYDTTTKDTEGKEDKEKKTAGYFDQWFDIAGKLGGVFSSNKDGGNSLTGQLQTMFKPLMDVFGALGWVDILWQRLKAIWLMIELTRKAKEKFVKQGQPLSSCTWLSWDRSIVNDPQRFVWSVRYMEVAIKANKDIIQPEYMKTEDFGAMIQLQDTQRWWVSQFSLLELLWLKNTEQTQLLVAEKPFADLDDTTKNNVMKDPQIAKATASKIISWLSLATEQWKKRTENRWNRDQERKNVLGKKGNEVLDLFATVSDPKDPNSLYSNVMKSINLIWWLLTGRSFTHDEYDDTAESKIWSWKTINIGEVRSDDDKELPVGNGVVHIGRWKEAIFVNESMDTQQPYWAINPESTAIGKYQFLMNTDKGVAPWFDRLTEYVSDQRIILVEESNSQYQLTKALLDKHSVFNSYTQEQQQLLITYMINGDLQEDFMNDIMKRDYLPSLKKLSATYPDQIIKNKLNTSELMMGVHFLGQNNMEIFLKEWWEWLSDEIKGKNKSWDQYIKAFRSAYSK